VDRHSQGGLGLNRAVEPRKKKSVPKNVYESRFLITRTKIKTEILYSAVMCYNDARW
jgi:hypothetical protein